MFGDQGFCLNGSFSLECSEVTFVFIFRSSYLIRAEFSLVVFLYILSYYYPFSSFLFFKYLFDMRLYHLPA